MCSRFCFIFLKNWKLYFCIEFYESFIDISIEVFRIKILFKTFFQKLKLSFNIEFYECFINISRKTSKFPHQNNFFKLTNSL